MNLMEMVSHMMKDSNFERESQNPNEPGEQEFSEDLVDEMESEHHDPEPMGGKARDTREPYLKELAHLPVLTQEARAEIWIRLERAQARVAEVVLTYPAVAKEVIRPPIVHSIDPLSQVMSDLVRERQKLISRGDQGTSDLRERENEIIHQMNMLFRELSINERQVDLFLEKLVSRMELAAGAMEEFEWFFSSSHAVRNGDFRLGGEFVFFQKCTKNGDR